QRIGARLKGVEHDEVALHRGGADRLTTVATGHNSCSVDFTEGALASNVQKQHRGGHWVRVEPLRRFGILGFELGLERRASRGKVAELVEGIDRRDATISGRLLAD